MDHLFKHNTQFKKVFERPKVSNGDEMFLQLTSHNAFDCRIFVKRFTYPGGCQVRCQNNGWARQLSRH